MSLNLRFLKTELRNRARAQCNGARNRTRKAGFEHVHENPKNEASRRRMGLIRPRGASARADALHSARSMQYARQFL